MLGLPRMLRSTMAVVVPVLLFAYGMWSFPLALLGPERALVPGDLGDSRFNNYILEHFHQYATGKVDDYWNAPFMYPYQNVVALSDNLLGTAPIYSLFRSMGYSRESAYQLWILALFSLNYFCCFIALFLWSKRSALAACGAFLFAFGIYTIGHLEHAQVFPKFMVPLAFWWCWQWLVSGRVKHMLFMALAVVYQFYCGIYIGFMLCYALAFLVIGYGVVNFRHLPGFQPEYWRRLGKGCAVLIAASSLLWPLMQPYVAASNAVGLREFAEVENTIPRLRSYFFTHPAALSWRSLSQHSIEGFHSWWSHFHFMGALPWLGIVLLPLVLWKSSADAGLKKSLSMLGIAFALSTVFCMRFGDFTLYKLVYHLPGFGSMRSMDRIVNVQAMYFATIMVMVFATISTRTWGQLALACCLPLAVVVDNKIDVRELKRYDKHDARKLVDRVVLDMQLQWDSSAQAIAYTPARGMMTGEEDYMRSVGVHLSAMLAAQQLGVATVNAYTGKYPGNYEAFWERLDQHTLNDWCRFNGLPSEDILVANNIHRPILAMDTISLVASNGKYVCIDPTHRESAFADRANPQLWETLVRLRLSDHEYAFIAHTDRFLSADLLHDGSVSSATDRLGDMGVFELVEQPDGRVALLADNRKFLTLDTVSLRLVARADSIVPECLFRIEQHIR
jgi:Fascin domain